MSAVAGCCICPFCWHFNEDGALLAFQKCLNHPTQEDLLCNFCREVQRRGWEYGGTKHGGPDGSRYLNELIYRPVCVCWERYVSRPDGLCDECRDAGVKPRSIG